MIFERIKVRVGALLSLSLYIYIYIKMNTWIKYKYIHIYIYIYVYIYTPISKMITFANGSFRKVVDVWRKYDWRSFLFSGMRKFNGRMAEEKMFRICSRWSLLGRVLKQAGRKLEENQKFGGNKMIARDGWPISLSNNDAAIFCKLSYFRSGGR